MKHIAKVKKGKLDFLNRQAFVDDFAQYEDRDIEIWVRLHKSKRSLNQNRYYFFICKLIAEETGDTPKDVHEALKFKILGKEQYSVFGEVYSRVRSTAKLNTKEFEDYLEQVRAFCASYLGMVIPLPNEAPITSYEYLT